MMSFIRQKLVNIDWTSRKFRLPLYGPGLVLEVGSGGNPHPFSDVLVEKYLEDTHRFAQLKVDRPLVLADATNLPFKDSAFSYSLAFHVLEHIENPARFLDEQCRVSLGGYLETPNALYERISPYAMHLLEIMLRGEELVIRKKSAPMELDPISQSRLLDSDNEWLRLFRMNPRRFHVCHEWQSNIRFSILNDKQSLRWFSSKEHVDASLVAASRSQSPKATVIRDVAYPLIKKLRQRKFDLTDLLECIECRSSLRYAKTEYVCLNDKCGARFSAHPFPNFCSPL